MEVFMFRFLSFRSTRIGALIVGACVTLFAQNTAIGMLGKQCESNAKVNCTDMPLAACLLNQGNGICHHDVGATVKHLCYPNPIDNCGGTECLGHCEISGEACTVPMPNWCP